eukprot:scaffold5297_cov374-Prasinococcus_capsulatus_cf.AAC.17
MLQWTGICPRGSPSESRLPSGTAQALGTPCALAARHIANPGTCSHLQGAAVQAVLCHSTRSLVMGHNH